MPLYIDLFDSAQESSSHLTHFIEEDNAQGVAITSIASLLRPIML
jgi:hypothetical protein